MVCGVVTVENALIVAEDVVKILAFDKFFGKILKLSKASEFVIDKANTAKDLIRSHLNNKLFVTLFRFVIPVQTGIQCFQAFLDARLRGHDSLFRKIIFEMASRNVNDFEEKGARINRRIESVRKWWYAE
jgi:hypothetical protein